MRTISMLGLLLLLPFTTVACGDSNDEDATTIELRYNFNEGDGGWVAAFSDYGPEFEMELDSGVAPLPDSLKRDGTGYRLTGMNRTDDLFMFLARRIDADDGIQAGQSYRVTYRIVFASDAPTGCAGIGGAPGEGVTLKAGVVSEEPEVELVDGYWELTVDKSNQASGGRDVWLVGDIANGIECEEALDAGQPYAVVEREYRHDVDVAAGSNAELWLIVGTDSGFEGRTTLYYMEIDVTLEPV
jgi:hypothetical protein